MSEHIDNRNKYSKWLSEWKSVAKKYGNYYAAQAILENPYIIEKNQDGALIKLLIANHEGQAWYDQIMYTELFHLHNFRMLRPGDIVFDCGANQAVNSLVYSHFVGPKGRVHAFDPFPLNGDIIEFNIALNNVRNIIYHPFGLSRDSGELIVSAAQQSISPKLTADGVPDAIKLNLRRLDEFAYLKPDFLKIDIEGAEVDALEGAKSILSQRPAIYLELHTALETNFNRKYMDVFDIIDMYNYKCFAAHPQRGMISYNMEFEMDAAAQLFFIPKDREIISRHFEDESMDERASVAAI